VNLQDRTQTLPSDIAMKLIFAFGCLVLFGSTLHAQPINVRGKVSNGAGQPVANAVVELMQQGLKDTTGTDGGYSVLKSGVPIGPLSGALSESMRLHRGFLEFTMGQTAPLKLEVFDVKGNLRKKEVLPQAQPGVYQVNLAPLSNSHQLLIVQASIGPLVRTFRYLSSQQDGLEGPSTLTRFGSIGGRLAKSAAVVDSLRVSAVGYKPEKIGLSSYDTTVNVTLAADATTVYNPCPTNGTPCKILPFGDSITEGVRSSDGAGYRSQLFKLIVAGKQKVTFTGSLTNGPTQVSGQPFPRTHEGHAGWTILPGYSEFPGYGGISSLVPSPALNGAPHMVLLHIGANDLFPKDRETMSTRLDELVGKIAQNAPNALIVLAQITPVGTANGGHTQAQVDAANAAQKLYNSRIPAIIQAHAAKGRHIIGVDMSKMPLTGLTTASLHPNDQGYAYMAGIWYEGIKDLLPK
jgi:lysophospholipase L1-like esterase